MMPMVMPGAMNPGLGMMPMMSPMGMPMMPAMGMAMPCMMPPAMGVSGMMPVPMMCPMGGCMGSMVPGTGMVPTAQPLAACGNVAFAAPADAVAPPQAGSAA